MQEGAQRFPGRRYFPFIADPELGLTRYAPCRRPIATHHDRCVHVFLSAVLRTATLSFW